MWPFDKTNTANEGLEPLKVALAPPPSLPCYQCGVMVDPAFLHSQLIIDIVPSTSYNGGMVAGTKQVSYCSRCASAIQIKIRLLNPSKWPESLLIDETRCFTIVDGYFQDLNADGKLEYLIPEETFNGGVCDHCGEFLQGEFCSEHTPSEGEERQVDVRIDEGRYHSGT